jgi:pyruvate/2-oxoglutarate dehydrogenase complex dihydrolipoamide acyltransferase (E2) component
VLVVIGGEPDGEQPRAEPPAADVAESAPPAASSSMSGARPRHGGSGPVRATPLVRKIAADLGVDLETIDGTGPQGRITEDDVSRAGHGPGGPDGARPQHGQERREPLRGVRRLIAEHMANAHREVPAVTWVEECDFSRVELKTLVATVLKAVAESLPEFPELNARFDDDAIVYLDRYDIGVAVQTTNGLVVPVVRNCDSRSVDELHAELERLAAAARAGSLKPEELRDSTFTVTSAGKLAGLFQTPIVNHPEVAILSIGRIADRPVVHGNALTIARTGYLSVTFDHRVVDGARAAEFGLAVIARLEAN